MPGTFIVIVNYRTGPRVVECLDSLASTIGDLDGGKVIVADNDSADDSVTIIERAISERGWRDWAELLVLPRNGGFAYGNNAAIARVRALDPRFDAVILLNPDTVVTAGAIRGLIDFFAANQGAGIAGASIQDDAGVAAISAHSQPSPITELDGAAQLGPLSRLLGRSGSLASATAPQRCDWVSGACMAIRREVFEAIGPMDEDFFLYFEEVDFCVRARRAGWTCWFVPGAHVVHFEGAATGIRAPRRRRPSYWYESRRRFFVKVYGVAGLIAADLLWAIGRTTLVARRALGLGGRARRHDEPTHMAWDLLGGDLRAIARGDCRAIERIASA